MRMFRRINFRSIFTHDLYVEFIKHEKIQKQTSDGIYAPNFFISRIRNEIEKVVSI